MRFKTYYLTERVVVKNEQLIKEIKKRYLTDIKDIEKTISSFHSVTDVQYKYKEKDMEKLKKYLRDVSDKYDNYIYKVVLANHMVKVNAGFPKHELSIWGTTLQKSAWIFVLFIRGIIIDLEFPKKTIDHNNFDKYKKKLIVKLKKLGNIMYKDAINYVNSLKAEEKEQDFAEPTRYKNGYFQPESGVTEKELNYVVDIYKKAYNLMSKTKVKKSLNDTILIKVDKTNSNQGSYNYNDDSITVKHFGESLYTMIHEYGHRYWFRYMKDDQRALWVNAYTNNLIKITPTDIDNLIGFMKNNKEEEDWDIGRHIKRIAPDLGKKYSSDPLIKYKIKYYIDYLDMQWGDITDPDDEKKLRDIALRKLVGEQLLKNKISNYGNTNYIEGFAEIFTNYFLKRNMPKDMEQYFLGSL